MTLSGHYERRNEDLQTRDAAGHLGDVTDALETQERGANLELVTE